MNPRIVNRDEVVECAKTGVIDEGASSPTAVPLECSDAIGLPGYVRSSRVAEVVGRVRTHADSPGVDASRVLISRRPSGSLLPWSTASRLANGGRGPGFPSAKTIWRNHWNLAGVSIAGRAGLAAGRHGRRVRGRPHPDADARGHEDREGKGQVARQATPTQPGPGGTPRRVGNDGLDRRLDLAMINTGTV